MIVMLDKSTLSINIPITVRDVRESLKRLNSPIFGSPVDIEHAIVLVDGKPADDATFLSDNSDVAFFKEVFKSENDVMSERVGGVEYTYYAVGAGCVSDRVLYRHAEGPNGCQDYVCSQGRWTPSMSTYTLQKWNEFCVVDSSVTRISVGTARQMERRR